MVDISGHRRNMEQINNITEDGRSLYTREQINNITEEINNDKPKKQYQFTEKRKLAFEKMKGKNRKKINIPDLERLLFIKCLSLIMILSVILTFMTMIYFSMMIILIFLMDWLKLCLIIMN